MTYNVKDFGAIPDGKTLNTKSVQSAIDKCSLNGGGIVQFDGGRYVLSTVFLRSNVTLEISENTEILGAESFYDYAPHEKIEYPLYQDASHSYFHTAMFVGIDCENIRITGKGKIDMRSVWDEENVRQMCCRGAKCISLKNCKNVEISGLEIYNATDLGVYFAGCENVEIFGLKMRVYIDGISPDNSKNVRIHDCDLETGDDGIVLKSSYTLGRLDVCKDVHVYNCKVKSRCNALKLGTETNGGFENVLMENVDVYETRLAGIAIESVDGAIVDGVVMRNITMRNVNAPLFIHVGRRMRGPVGREIGKIKNVLLENITADGPYVPYEVVSWNYWSYKANDTWQEPWTLGNAADFCDTDEKNTADSAWQMTSNICGLKESPLENIALKDVKLTLDGGATEYERNVPEIAQAYPEVYVYGRILPAKGIYFRYIKGLKLERVQINTKRFDVRQDVVLDSVEC